MPSPELLAGALSLILIHDESGCLQSAIKAARLLECICDTDDLDAETRALCQRASERLGQGYVH